MLKKYGFHIFLLLLIAESCVLIYYSLLPGFGPVVEVEGFRLGDIDHFAAYLVYGILIERTLSYKMGSKRFLIAFIWASLFGGLCEFLQGLVPFRVMDPIDWTVDSLGALTGILILFVGKRAKAFK